MTTRYVSLLFTTVVMLFVAACGGDDPAPSPSPAATRRSGGLPTSPIPNSTLSVPPPLATKDLSTTEPFASPPVPNPWPETLIALLREIRIGVQPDGWDRVVFEFKDARPAVEILYVDKAQTCGKGDNVSLPGAAMLSVKFRQTQAHTDAGASTLPSRDITGPGTTILKASVICDFEGETGVAIGVKTKTPYKVTMLQNPTRVVIDVKQ